MAYAKGTKTSIDTTERQIKTMLIKAGAEGTAFMEERARAIVAFHLNGRSIQFRLPLPVRDDFAMRKANQYGAMVQNSADTRDNLWVQACRERWRQLHLCIKAKLESVEQNIETFDEAFLPHIQMPDGETIGDKVLPEMQAQLNGRAPRALLPAPAKEIAP
jgi:hypothetical protein